MSTVGQDGAAQSDAVDRILAAIPASLRDRPGAALLSGLDSWTNPSPIYLLGYNPGGDPAASVHTVEQSAAWILNQAGNYSSYRDEEWSTGRGSDWAAGRHPMQRSVLGLFDRLGIDAGTVPSSNTFYARSREAAHVAQDDARAWQEECWPFHAEMIERLQVRVVICMGMAAANFVRDAVGSNTVAATFEEDNNRRYKSRIYTGGTVTVVQTTHPSRFPWYSKGCDLTPLVAQALALAGAASADGFATGRPAAYGDRGASAPLPRLRVTPTVAGSPAKPKVAPRKPNAAQVEYADFVASYPALGRALGPAEVGDARPSHRVKGKALVGGTYVVATITPSRDGLWDRYKDAAKVTHESHPRTTRAAK